MAASAIPALQPLLFPKGWTRLPIKALHAYGKFSARIPKRCLSNVLKCMVGDMIYPALFLVDTDVSGISFSVGWQCTKNAITVY